MDKHILYKFFAGNTSEEETVQVLNWMKESEEHKEELFRERRLFNAVLLTPDDPVSAYSPRSSGKWRPMLIQIGSVAAAVAITMILSYYYFKASVNPLPEKTMNTITVPAGQRVNLTLGDGTNIWLNARTTFRYPTSFQAGQREVFIDGEAYFDVTHDTQHPFIVNTDNYKVKVLGTQFNIQAYSENGQFETALMQGSVEVASAADASQLVALQPNQTVSVKDNQFVLASISDFDIYRWKEGLICFKNQSFDQIIREFEKVYGVQIVVQNTQVLKRMYTGKFRQSDGVMHALRALQLNISFKFERDDEENIVYIK